MNPYLHVHIFITVTNDQNTVGQLKSLIGQHQLDYDVFPLFSSHPGHQWEGPTMWNMWEEFSRLFGSLWLLRPGAPMLSRGVLQSHHWNLTGLSLVLLFQTWFRNQTALIIWCEPSWSSQRQRLTKEDQYILWMCWLVLSEQCKALGFIHLTILFGLPL